MKGCIALVLLLLTTVLFSTSIWYMGYYFNKKSFEGTYIYNNTDSISFLSNAILEIKPNNDFVYDFRSNEVPSRVGYCLGTWSFQPQSFINAVDYTSVRINKTHFDFYKGSFPLNHSKSDFDRIPKDSIANYFSGSWFFKHHTKDSLSVTFDFMEDSLLKSTDLLFLRE